MKNTLPAEIDIVDEQPSPFFKTLNQSAVDPLKPPSVVQRFVHLQESLNVHNRRLVPQKLTWDKLKSNENI